MKTRLLGLSWTLLAFALFGAPLCAQDPQPGTLAFDLKSYSSAVKLDENIKKQLQHAGPDWGMVDDALVVSLVNKKYVKAELPYLTRYGEQKVLQVRPGEYKITCIGYIFRSTSRDVDKELAASAFFNIAVLKFNVLPGKTTILEILPTMQKQSKSSFLVSLKMFMPDLKLKVIEDGVVKAEGVISQKTSSSVAWNDYTGPLKF